MEGRGYGNTNRGRGRHSDGGRSRGRGPVQAGYGRTSPSPTHNPPPPQSQYADRQPPSAQVGGRGYAAAAAAPPGGRRGWEQQVAVRPSPTPSPPPKIDTGLMVPDIRSLSITNKSIATDETEVRGQMVPMRRPDRGGSLSKRLTSIVVNHFHVGYNPSMFIRHYDIDIKPEKSPKQIRPLKMKNEDFRLIRNQLSFSRPDQFPLDKIGYDGKKNIYSVVDLPTGQFKVKYSEAEDREGNTFLVSVKLVNQFDLTKLREYLTGSLCTIPRDVMQGLDVVMKEHPARHMILSGGCFYPPQFNDRRDTIGNGIIASSGFQHSLKPTSQGLALCVDYSVAPFRKPVGVVEFLSEYLRNFNMSNFKASKRKDVERVLIGLKVQVTHRRTRQKFRIKELTVKDTRDLSFKLRDPAGVAPERDIFLADYFMETYGWEVQHLDAPCLEFGRKDKPNYVPMECCQIVPGQRLAKDELEKDTARRLKDMSVVAPKARMETIKSMVDLENGPRRGNVLQNFGLSVENGMTKVKGRVIGPPELKIGSSHGNPSRVLVDQERCQWNLGGKCVLEGTSIDQWAVIDFTAFDRFRLDANKFIPSLINRCMNLRIRLDDGPFYQKAKMDVLSSDRELRNLLQHVIKKTETEKKGKPQFILCAMTNKHEGYKMLKLISETEIGVVTQCCLSGAANKGNDQYFANLAMKINAKLGGSNMELFNQLPRFEREKNVMFVGADVNHPSQSDPTIPSIAAVVATMNWPGANRYAARVQAQAHRCERILNFAEMCFDLVQSYESINGKRPDRIMIFRDGVSDDQFDMVLNEELASLKQLFKTQGYSPSLTLIVARKRHLTRLFLEDMREGGRSANISPGTVVDTTIVHPYDFDFYLCSHHGAIGTSKPTHYHVLLDDHGFSSDELQKFIYFLCFTFARCTKPVSLVTPVYYADLVAYRGRMYYEASLSLQSSTSSRPSASGTPPNIMSTMKLHSNLENSMFFI